MDYLCNVQVLLDFSDLNLKLFTMLGHKCMNAWA